MTSYKNASLNICLDGESRNEGVTIDLSTPTFAVIRIEKISIKSNKIYHTSGVFDFFR